MIEHKEQGIFAEIALFSAIEKTLHYRVPLELAEQARVGVRVVAPLGPRETCGLIVALHDAPPESSSGITFRPLLAVLDPHPAVPEDLIALCRWVSEYYFYPIGEVLQAALPSSMEKAHRLFFRLTPAGREAIQGGSSGGGGLSGLLGLLSDLLLGEDKISLDAISARLSAPKSLRRDLKTLEERGYLEHSYEWQLPRTAPKKVKSIELLERPPAEHIERNDNLRTFMRLLEESRGVLPMQVLRQHVSGSAYWVKKLQQGGFIRVKEIEEIRESGCSQCIAETDPPTLSADQEEAVRAILPHILQQSFQPFLLFGVTGSGKTEIYLQLAQRALEEGKSVLALVPEIALSTQMEALFRQRFGLRLAVWHSGLSSGVRYDQWREILSGKRKIILGVRSAVFMPLSSPGLIIVDEEHDASYKQDDRLRYHARDVALVRARMLSIPIVLGSATPSLQTIHQSRSGRYQSLSLPQRVMDRPLPKIHLVDMRRESRRNAILSHSLQTALRETVQNGEQALIFLNRRGFATFLLCNACGQVLQCVHCSVSLTYHQKENRMRCHYCGWECTLPDHCAACGHASLTLHGFGTERVEEEIKRLLPNARVVRIDRDTVNHARDLVESLDAMRHAQADILLGTQMIAKGHDFPNITLVGIVNADTGLQIPDFRAGETTVQLLMQVAGRAGRGEKPGRVILQTYNPSHYTILSALEMDYAGFCDKELESRRLLQYPPFARLAKLLVTAGDEKTTQEAAHKLAAICREVSAELRHSDLHVAVLGPSAAPLVKLSNRYRWHLFIKAWTSRNLQYFIETVLSRCKNTPILRRVQLAVDRDPMSSL